MKQPPIQVVDLFAGPGGLGEGFSSFNNKFRILVSAEMEDSAHKTLTLRSYFRILKSEAPELLQDYYDYCNGASTEPHKKRSQGFWKQANQEARKITLGSPQGNRELDSCIETGLDTGKPWVLIGGPPCQAYSLVGRARNKGVDGYNANEDHRHFLYKEYLRIISQYKPTIFVMENVKGILSSTISGKRIFHEILDDLSSPNKAVGGANSERYVICSLTTGDAFHNDEIAAEFDVTKFIIRAENFEIPQARHRVILLGIKESYYRNFETLKEGNRFSVNDALADLPPLRSKLSRQPDCPEAWKKVITQNIENILEELIYDTSKLSVMVPDLLALKANIKCNLSTGSLKSERLTYRLESNQLSDWFNDPRLNVWLNHESRGHMNTDLKRYLFASVYAQKFGVSPKGVADFSLPGLSPNHRNWSSGKFADRFRVQIQNKPSSTITSHIAKDGHYFIHPDPAQCRSLTVREAARIQTFPDNYFFQGNRTQQYHQVGNAVPPYLAYQIAKVVSNLLEMT